ncbi:hypothetical protein CNR22_19380 [Sphingobacteriaceae bacterium]|nr:hypothetical protein CNR22_19380 [Sphingobacteriaceae bacterium]
MFSKKTVRTKKKSLLLLRLDSIGDYVIFRNFIDSLKSSSRYQNYEITLCGNIWWKELSEKLDSQTVSSFIWIDYMKMADPLYRFKVLRKIHNRGFEILIHPTYSRDSVGDLIVANSGAEIKIGFSGDLVNLTLSQKENNNRAYSELIESPSECMFEFYRNKLFFESILAEKISLSRPSITSENQLENKIIICPGAKDSFRRWSPFNFAALCDKLKIDFPEKDFVICGSAADSVFAKEIIRNSTVHFQDSTGELGLNELLSVFSNAKLIVTNDSGPFHIAVALGKKAVCISNGNNYGRFTPYPAEMQTSSAVIYPDELLNLPSEEEKWEKYCKHGSPLDINSIGVAKVYETIKKLV